METMWVYGMRIREVSKVYNASIVYHINAKNATSFRKIITLFTANKVRLLQMFSGTQKQTQITSKAVQVCFTYYSSITSNIILAPSLNPF